MERNILLKALPLLMAIFVDAMGVGLILPILTPIFLDNSLSMEALNLYQMDRNLIFGLILAAYPLAMFFGAPLLGVLSDYWGRKPVLLISLLGLSTGFAITAVSICYFSFVGIIIGRVICGLTAGNVPIAQAAISDLSTNEKKVFNMSLISIANGVGFACGPLVGGLLADKHIFFIMAPVLPLVATSLVALINGLLMLIFFNETHIVQKKHFAYLDTFRDIVILFNDKSLRNKLTVFSFFIFGYFEFFQYLPVFLDQRFKETGAQLGFYLSYYAICFTISLLVVLPVMLKRYSISKLIINSFLFLAAAIFCFCVETNAMMLWVLITPMAMAFALCYVCLITVLSNEAGSRNQGKVMGVCASVTALSWAIGPVVTGLLNKLSLYLPFMLIIILIAFSALSAFYFLSDAKKFEIQNEYQ